MHELSIFNIIPSHSDTRTLYMPHRSNGEDVTVLPPTLGEIEDTQIPYC